MDAQVIYLFGSGLAGVTAAVAGWTPQDWNRPACGTWSGTDLAGHLVTVIGWYHDWLDRGLAGIVEPAFGIPDLDRQTAAALAALPAADGPTLLDEFGIAAEQYLDRIVQHWDTPFAYPRGLVTAGQHAAVAAWEWHLHAWDLATAAGVLYQPHDAATLYARGTECIAAATGSDPPTLEPANPWEVMLQRTGRLR